MQIFYSSVQPDRELKDFIKSVYEYQDWAENYIRKLELENCRLNCELKVAKLELKIRKD